MNTTSKQAGSKGAQAKPEQAHRLRELLEAQLKDIYWAEKALTKAMPKMIDNASTHELFDALSEHLDVTDRQVVRLDEVFKSLGLKAEARKCDAMEGLIKEAEAMMKSTEKGVVRDAGIISAAQKIEHYEIASYGTLRSFADLLGETDAATLLEETLNEEKDADATLTVVAESINVEAVH